MTFPPPLFIFFCYIPLFFFYPFFFFWCLLVFFFLLFFLPHPLSQGHMKQKNGNRCPFWPVSAVVSVGIGRISLFRWPFWPELAVSTCFGGHFGRIGSRFRWNWPESRRVNVNRCKSKKKKGSGGESTCRMPDAASDSSMTTLEPHQCFLNDCGADFWKAFPSPWFYD